MKKLLHLLSYISLFFTISVSYNSHAQIPKGFTYLADVSPSIQIDLRYAGNNNFVGSTIDGYTTTNLILTRPAAKQLHRVQKDLNKLGLGLKVFDGYRPQRAVNHFKRWAKDLNDTLQKRAYYPREQKRDLFKHGYIASRSGHSRGSTVDLTLVYLSTGEEVDMGFPFDFFGKESGAYYLNISLQQRKNRALLRAIMLKHSFRSYAKEWWHFTLKNEPFPKTYFDFVAICHSERNVVK